MQKNKSNVNISPLSPNVNIPGKIDNSNNSNNESPFLPIKSLQREKWIKKKLKDFCQKFLFHYHSRNKLSPPLKHKIINNLGQGNNNLNYNYYDYNSNPNINVYSSAEIKTNNINNINTNKNILSFSIFYCFFQYLFSFVKSKNFLIFFLTSKLYKFALYNWWQKFSRQIARFCKNLQSWKIPKNWKFFGKIAVKFFFFRLLK